MQLQPSTDTIIPIPEQPSTDTIIPIPEQTLQHVPISGRSNISAGFNRVFKKNLNVVIISLITPIIPLLIIIISSALEMTIIFQIIRGCILLLQAITTLLSIILLMSDGFLDCNKGLIIVVPVILMTVSIHLHFVSFCPNCITIVTYPIMLAAYIIVLVFMIIYQIVDTVE